MRSANYHTHTVRCGHACGTEEEYVKSAIEAGLEVLGFADHSPQPYGEDFVSPVRMKMVQLPEYVDALLKLREKYREQIDIRIGLEVEYFPDLFEQLLKELAPYPIDYLIMGQHFVHPEKLGRHVIAPTDEEEELAGYVDRVLEGLETGKFAYVAHPDMFHFIGDEEIYRKHMTRLCQECRRMDIPLEINLLGLAENRIYPREAFWKIAAGMGNHVIIGCDAHKPDALQDAENYRKGMEFAGRLGIIVDEGFRIESMGHN